MITMLNVMLLMITLLLVTMRIKNSKKPQAQHQMPSRLASNNSKTPLNLQERKVERISNLTCQNLMRSPSR